MNPAVSIQYFDIENLLRDLPRGDRWITHLKEDLLPFWIMPSALGDPVGNFPTYRNNDGSLVDPNNLQPEFQHVVPGVVWLNRDHVRAKSRQCFAYGVAYHMTVLSNIYTMRKPVSPIYLSTHWTAKAPALSATSAASIEFQALNCNIELARISHIFWPVSGFYTI